MQLYLEILFLFLILYLYSLNQFLNQLKNLLLIYVFLFVLVMLTFLEVNGVELDFTEDELVKYVELAEALYEKNSKQIFCLLFADAIC